MGLFGLGKKKEMDVVRSDENKAKMRALFDQVVEEGDSYKIVYGYTSDVKNSYYGFATKTTYTYGSFIVGYRDQDMSIVLLETDPEISGCGDAHYYKKSDIKKATFSDKKAMHELHLTGGLRAVKILFGVMERSDFEHLAYITQKEEFWDWYEFWEKFRA